MLAHLSTIFRGGSTRAAVDALAYPDSLLAGRWEEAQRIERRWGLGDCPPELVSEILDRVAGGATVKAALASAWAQQ